MRIFGDRREKVENRDLGDVSQHLSECIGNDSEEGIGFCRNAGGDARQSSNARRFLPPSSFFELKPFPPLLSLEEKSFSPSSPKRLSFLYLPSDASPETTHPLIVSGDRQIG